MTLARRPPRPDPRNPVHLLACGFGSGLAPRAPGTCGTAAGVIVFLLLPPLDPFTYVSVCAGLAALGVWICARTTRDLGVHDHPAIVIDEMVGYLITMTAAPEGWIWIVAGFSLFRILDILKPWPIGWLDRTVGGGLGIMADDVVAGALACVALQGLYRLAG